MAQRCWLTEQFRDCRRKGSRSRTLATQSETQPQCMPAVPVLAHQTVPPVTRAKMSACDEPRHDQAKRSSSTQAEAQGVHDNHVMPAMPVTEPASDPTSPMSLGAESSNLWEMAYEKLRDENKSLIEHYEAVLKDRTGISQSTNLRDGLAMVAETQRKKVENKQWKFHWFGEEQTARDAVDRILNLINKSASLISIGMNYAPIHEHKGCIDGLEIVARLTFSYQSAERVFLDRKETKSRYKTSVIPLYKKILEYQARSFEYFGKSTLRRLGKNVLGSTEWADMPTEISSLDNETRRSLDFLGLETEITGIEKVQEFLERQEHGINTLIQRAVANQDHVAQIIDWVSPISVQLDHLEVRKNLGQDHFSSGNWYLQERKVRDWMAWTGSSRCLWLRGSVGMGKSCLASIFIEDLVSSLDGVVALFYCSRKADQDNVNMTSRNDYTNTLRSILAQVAVSIDGTAVHQDVIRRFNEHSRRTLPGIGLSDNDCIRLLDGIFSLDSKFHFTIVIDALDECKNYDALLESLKKAIGSNNNVRVAFTSRLQVKVDDVFPDAAAVTIDSRNKGDIQRFLGIEIPKRRVGSGMTDSQATKFIELVVGKASGMFLWAKLQLNLFLDENKSRRIRLEEDIQVKLNSLEASEAVGEDLLLETYNDVYDTAVGGTSQPHRKEIVITALCWVLCAFRPLKLRELAYATSVRRRAASSVEEGLILEFCSNLIIEDTVGIIRFPHLSVRHYLEARNPPDFNLELAHLQASLTCLYFANSPHFHEIEQSRGELVQHGNVTLTKSFYSYVSAYWPRHCRQARRNDEVNRLLDSFAAKSKLRQTRSFSKQSENTDENQRFLEGSGADEEPIKAAVQSEESDTNETGIPELSMMTFRCFLELTHSPSDVSHEFVAHCIARGADLGIKDSYGSTLLHEAIRLRQLESARALIDAVASFNAQDHLGNTPLHIASMRGFVEGTRQLLLAGADRSPRNSRGETPLHLAVMFEAQEVVEALLSANADALARDHQDNTALHYATATANVTTLESLLLMGYNPNGRNQDGDSAISLAIKLRSEPLVSILLSHDAVLTEEDRALVASSESSEVIRLVSQYNPMQLTPPKEENPEDNMRYLYGVDLENSSSLCQYCQVVRWIMGSRTGTSYPHCQSIQLLYISADTGCPVCAFFRKELEQHKWPEDSYLEGKLIITIDPSSTQGSRWDRKDKLVLYSGETRLLTYELCVDRTEDPLSAFDWLTGTTIRKVPEDPSCLETIRNWIKICDSHHEECSGDGIPLLPTRVLDVGETSDVNVRLILSQTGQMGKYLYLSFMWGKAMTFINTKARVSMLSESVPLVALPATLRDGIFLTRLLGLRYLWIDGLCIIQDSAEDVRRENSMVESYIQNAAFVIVAAAGRDSSSGLFHARQQPLLHMDFTQDTAAVGEGTSREKRRATVYLRHPLKTAAEALSETALTRVWMVQEVILARRLLILGTDQIYWHCRTSLRSEGSSLVQQPFLKLLPREQLVSIIPGRNISFFPWYSFIFVYSPAQTVHGLDRLLAVRVVARYFDRTSQFAGGLWAEDLQNGLLWYLDDVMCSERTDIYVAPSWSWASVQGGVRYNLLLGCRHEKVPPSMAFSVLELVLGESHDTVDYAYLTVEAMTLETSSLNFDKRRGVYFFDHRDFEMAWRSSCEFLLVFICPWSPTWGADQKQARGLGLILRNLIHGVDSTGTSSLEEINYKPSFIRAGIFLLDSYNGRLPEWTRKTVRIF
ncbi:hypothetical protein F4678DRAFT_465083 [Xylaria arbuscula]|nr:hypothetical protein F4678DRAFT_465083 [Xylaria arbuscula]